MSKKIYYKTLHINLYVVEVVFVCTDTIDNFTKTFNVKLASDEVGENSFKTYNAMTISIKETINLFYIVFNKHTNLGELCHEADHVTNFIFRYRGIKFDPNNDETHAYLIGYIFLQLMKFRDSIPISYLKLK